MAPAADGAGQTTAITHSLPAVIFLKASARRRALGGRAGGLWDAALDRRKEDAARVVMAHVESRVGPRCKRVKAT